jgi:2-deoxy-D-gluconate 3-dehydrogenase
MSTSFRLDGATALVTGASRGLGRAAALALADAGADVICASSKPDGAAETVRAIEATGRHAWGVHADLADRDAVRAMCEAADRIGTVGILVNNGGTIARFPAVDYPMDEWDRVLKTNLDATWMLAQHFGRGMIARGAGKIINVSSLLAFTGGITVPAYTASKHAVAGLTKALANEWAKHGVNVNAVAPGYFRTDNTQRLQDDATRATEITARIPAGRWGVPDDLAGAIVFLAAPASDYVHGTLLTVDGGWMAR